MILDKNNKSLFWDGTENKLIRFYFYAQRGLSLLNEARYLLIGTFALYYTLRLDNPIFLVLIFLVAVPVLIALGWLSVHRMGKVIEWLNIQYSTHWGRYQYTLLEEIRDELRNKKEDCSCR